MNTVRVMVPREAFIGVYMMRNGKHGTLTIGVKSNRKQRVWRHREGGSMGFTKSYGLKRFVWYGQHEKMIAAIQREKPRRSMNAVGPHVPARKR